MVLCGESEEDLRAMGVRFLEMRRSRGLEVNAPKSKEYEVCVEEILLKNLRYFRCVLEE